MNSESKGIGRKITPPPISAMYSIPRDASGVDLPRSHAGLVLGVITLGAIAIWASWWIGW